MTETSNLHLKKPVYGEPADIQMINGNMDAIDNEVGKVRLQLAPAAGKTTPVDDDYLVLDDSADMHKKKFLTWANIKATLRNLFYTKAEVSEELSNKADITKSLTSLGITTSIENGILQKINELPVGQGGYLASTDALDRPISSFGNAIIIPSGAGWSNGFVLWSSDGSPGKYFMRNYREKAWLGDWFQLATASNGTWTPVLEGATTSFLEHQSKYSIIGNVVYFTTNIKVKITAVTGTAATITGLPVIPDAQVVMCSANTFNIVSRFSGDDGIKASVQGGRIHLSYAATTNDTNWIIPVTNIHNFGFLTITGFYYI